MRLIESFQRFRAGGNERQNWANFDSDAYAQENYAEIMPLDAEVLVNLVEFYKKSNPQGRFLEVGAGSNMYPILAALPYSDSMDIWEYSPENVKYLNKQTQELDPLWNPWIDMLRSLDPETYGTYNFQDALQTKVNIVHGSLYGLPEGVYDNVSMHSVAESITARRGQFNKAVNKVVNAGKRGSTLVTTFVEKSTEYPAGGTFFALPIETRDAVRLIVPHMDSLHFGTTEASLRPGSRLIMAMGRRK